MTSTGATGEPTPSARCSFSENALLWIDPVHSLLGAQGRQLADLRQKSGALCGGVAVDKLLQLSGQLGVSRVSGSPEVMAATQRDAVHYYNRPDADLTYDTTRTALSGYAGEIRFALYVHRAGRAGWIG